MTMERLLDLNTLSIANADGPDRPLRPRGAAIDRIVVGSKTECYFDRLPARMVAFIEEFPIVVGCMAWLTNESVLKALSERTEVSIIVQKEDFLRPDVGNWNEQKIKRLYKAIPPASLYSTGAGYNSSCDPEIEGVRCAGVAKERKSVPPRMHHKFLVGCRFVPKFPREPDYDIRIYKPVAAWTGSFNATENGARSLENAVILRDPNLAVMYYDEWVKILGISESLNWTSPYVDPEYRIGT